MHSSCRGVPVARDINSDSQRKRRVRLASSASFAARGARLAALMCSGFAAIAVAITLEEGLGGRMAGFVAPTAYYAISAACPTFFLTLLFFERLQRPTWLSALSASWPWSLGLVCSAVALMPHRRPWLLLLVMLAAFGIDYSRTFRHGIKAMSRESK